MSDKVHSRQAKIDKINKLFAVSASEGATEQEAAKAGALATKLMAQWLIEEAELEQAQTGSTKPPVMGCEVVPFLGERKAQWEAGLAYWVSRACHVHMFTNTSKSLWNFAGREHEAKIAAYMFETLRTQLDVMSRTALSAHNADMKLRFGRSIYNVKQCRELSGHHPTVYRSRWLASWFQGAASVVCAKVEATLVEVAQESSSQALMVIEQRDEEAEEWATVTFKLVRGKKARSILLFQAAVEQGRMDGQNADIRKGIEGPTTQLKLLLPS